MPTEEELFAGVDALLEKGPLLPPPQECRRLREAAGLTQDEVAAALRSSRETVNSWEAGRSRPRPPRLQAYRRLLDGWAARFPAEAAAGAEPVASPRRPAVKKAARPARPLDADADADVAEGE